ncbi:MAG: DJ-1/PfpI family protein [Lachnospiraceae bacterium]|nr:DJ-1/PfpI family protein [Lachnospiraceae bacterium]
MKKVYAFLADGFEEVEALAVIDLLKRAKIETIMVSIMDSLTVTGAHDIKVVADKLYSEIDYRDADLLFLPGGGLGTKNLKAHKELADNLLDFAKDDTKRIAAICAAPSVLGLLNILNNKKATCYPGFEEQLLGADVVADGVVTDGRITTAKGMGVSIALGLELISLLIDKETSDRIKAEIQHP